MNIILNINDKDYPLELSGHETLLEVLRDVLNFTGTKTSCQEGECGACTVIVNGKAVLSCLTLASVLEGEKITTIEGLAQADTLHPLQESFLEHGAVQCGFCTPGMIMSSKALLDKNEDPSSEEIKHALDGNICRCTGYLKIIDAVKSAGKKMKK